MKIVHLGNVPVPVGHPEHGRVKQHPGRWVLNHALAQKAAGMDVEIVSQAHKASRDFDCEIEGVKVYFLRTFHPYRHFTFYTLDAWRMAHFVRRLNPDIVHAHGTENTYGHAAVRSGFPFCITAQGLFFQIIPTLGRPPTWNERFLRRGEDAVWKKTKFAVAKSEYVKSALAEKYPQLDLTLIPNTYEPALDAPLAPRSGHAVAYVGTMDERKGIRYLVEAMREVVKAIPDVELHVIGNPPEGTAQGYTGECLRFLRKTFGPRLVLHGRVPSRELFSILDGCRALVAPSLEEMFGNQLVEGLMRGCHGIVAEGTALAENARRFGNATVIPQRDSASIATALRSELSNPFNSAIAESARQRIRDWMSPVVVATAHEKFYDRILQNA
jgi:glycosyltransferase involved in cell wall biosynthesis